MGGYNYSPFERLIARALGATPSLKRAVKKCYQYANWLIHKKSHAYESLYPVKAIGGESTESFFGYYDNSPLSPNGIYFIYHSSTYNTKHMPDPSVLVEVVLARADGGQILARIPSSAYNWQQGTKLQWISDDRFAFNDYNARIDRYESHIFDAGLGKIVQTLPMPIYDCYGDRFALTLSFDRLARLAPDYGYFCRMDLGFDLDILDKDGIWYINMATGENQLILSLARLAKMNPLPSMAGAKHSVNHIMISPDGLRFMVIHRWYRSGRRFDRLVVADIDGAAPLVLADADMVSHCFWADDNTIFGYLRGPEKKDAYWLIEISTGKFTPFTNLELIKYGDGHPHLLGDFFVTDTYPDKARMQHLILANRKTGETRELGEFFHGLNYSGETRCDLHPRFSPDGKSVFFDSVFSGKRKLYTMDLDS